MGRKQAYGRPKPTLQISRSKSSGGSSRSSPAISPISSAAPKTPADEGIEFFQGEVNPGETPIQVYELALDPDGGPSKALSVCVIYSWFEVAHIALSTFAFHQLTRHTFYASPSRREPPRLETAYLRPISRLMEGSFHAKSSASESAFRSIR